ncbi:TetR/AcrR family transcriptional regulator [Nocardioides sp. JQ2195]|uniref:TetR/AcrR family transcriptional regulator n=1 Tax=Nocardioides sp. JQ2195 TaxID=2592334 RepID=UPI00143E835C|nr:TetR/AcrR family transcriptional regulator [Nocardioides sp. JQ2195]QIX28358.1 TetR/AcrR family transcriptional regulator [Nocardioides sp. JQ2195]
MTSIRHKAYLEAARECILDVGWKRTTLTDVARRAGVSRMTIYRAWPDMATLLADLMTQEWLVMLGAVQSSTDQVPTPRRIADGMIAALGALRQNPLLRRIIELDPELLLPYLVDRRGRSQEAILDFLLPQIIAGQEAGTIRGGDPVVLARTLVLAAHGLALSAQTMADGAITEQDLSTTFAELITGGLTP